MKLLETLVGADIPVDRLMPGTGCSALTDTVELTRHALSLGVNNVLTLPPFFYKGVTDEGLFRSYAQIIERVGSDALRIYLYHIPPVSQVPLSLALIERLLAAFPGVIAGVKDSSGDWSNTQAMLERFQPHGFDVFAGSENFLLATMRAGGVGCITATGNVNPAAIVQLYRHWQSSRRRCPSGSTRCHACGVRQVPDDPCAQGGDRRVFERSRLGHRTPSSRRSHASAMRCARRRTPRNRLLHAGIEVTA